MQRCWNDEEYTTEQAAYGVALSLRQKHQQIKIGVDLIADGKIAAGIHQLKPYIHQVSSKEARVQAIACDYLALTPDERKKTLLLAETNRERLAIAQIIREGLKAEGGLGQSIVVKRLKTKDLTEMQTGYAHHFRIHQLAECSGTN